MYFNYNYNYNFNLYLVHVHVSWLCNYLLHFASLKVTPRQATLEMTTQVKNQKGHQNKIRRHQHQGQTRRRAKEEGEKKKTKMTLM